MKIKRNKNIKLFIVNELGIKYNSKQFKNIYFIIFNFHKKMILIYPNKDDNYILNLYKKSLINKNLTLIF